ncbi:MAG: hypothetical protein OS112_01725 [Methanoregula sp.]|nr:MAG: hypothetical protein OS112_01725 [Methanoregula sp.]
MGELQGYDQYPVWMVLVSNLLSISVYVIGAVIISQIGLIWLVLYVLFILILEVRLVRGHCVDCYYYGKTCAFAKGRLSCMFFPRGKPEQFYNRTITWKDIVPDFLVFIIPVLVGTGLLIHDFSWTLLVLIIILFFLGFAGNAVVRGQIACRYCRQKRIGCPAQRLFEKK